jgi:FkbM family methyltransferase
MAAQHPRAAAALALCVAGALSLLLPQRDASLRAPAAHAFSPSHGDCAPAAWDAAAAPPAAAVVLRADAPGEFSLALPPRASSFVTESMLRSRIWAPIETQIFAAILTSPHAAAAAAARALLAVDVGVNVGWFSFAAAALGAEVIGFEPQPRASAYLNASAALNPALAARVRLYACAVGAAPGAVTMSVPLRWGLAQVASVDGAARPVDDFEADAAAAAGGKVRVPLVRLADVVAPGRGIALLKIDVEGFEAAVLEGARPLLAHGATRNILVEIKAPPVREFFMRELAALGYGCRQYVEPYFTAADARSPRTELLVAIAASVRACDPAAVGEDFWFSHKDIDFPEPLIL